MFKNVPEILIYTHTVLSFIKVIQKWKSGFAVGIS